MRRIALILKRSEQQAVVLGERLSRFIKEDGRDVLLESSQADLAGRWGAATSDRIGDDADVFVVLGGDGTILRAASLLNAKTVPVLGVNLGRVGYMAEISPDEAESELRLLLDGSAELVKRMMLQVTLPDGRVTRVLNDVVIHWGARARLIDLGVRMGDSREIEVRADGLILCTPIGSSAYSYAANGPLVHPDIEAMLLTPICPYSGLLRTLAIPASMETELVLKRGEELTLTLDGHATVRLETGQSIRIVRSPLPFLMVKSRSRDYFDVLKEKLGLL
ncbi:MAG: NAD(+)/NADH kinase [Desulfomonile sp.]|nr:NAD(+)/NADH kinase [Desulfomonile sp.]